MNGVLALLPTPLGEVASCARDGKVQLWELNGTGGIALTALRGHGDENGQDVTNKQTVRARGWEWA